MDNDKPEEVIHTRFWEEIAENDNPFAAALCRCAGYDVYGDLLGNATWIDYLYLLFHGEQPNPEQSRLMDSLALAIANPGPRDCSVQAAMTAGAGGSTLAACLMAALAVGAGNLGGAREVYEIMLLWEHCGHSLEQWKEALNRYRNFGKQPPEMSGIWPTLEHPPGFDPYGKSCPTPVRQTLSHLAQIGAGNNLTWLNSNRAQLEALVGLPVAVSGVAAAAFMDLKFDPQQGEMLYLLMRLPGAAAHALEQHWKGFRQFPFYRDGIDLVDDPGPASPTRRK